MAPTRRTTRRMTGSKGYVMANPRGVAEDQRIARTEDGKEFHEGDRISADEISDVTAKAWLARGQIVEA